MNLQLFRETAACSKAGMNASTTEAMAIVAHTLNVIIEHRRDVNAVIVDTLLEVCI